MPKVPTLEIEPYWTTRDERMVRLYRGNVEDVLRSLPERSVHCVVTSPPYWGLRDYGTDKSLELGSEKTPQEYVARMVRVFREVRRVLRDDGTLWLNLGDTYGGGGNYLSTEVCNGSKKLKQQQQQQQQQREQYAKYGAPNSRLASGNLVGIPWRVAFALQEDGWVLRQDIVWAKPSPMPESVRNRCTKAHEYVFLFAKRMGYFYDAEAIKEGALVDNNRRSFRGGGTYTNNRSYSTMEVVENSVPGCLPAGTATSRNKRDVWTLDSEQRLLEWLAFNDPALLSRYLSQLLAKKDTWTVSSQGYDGAHFATYPPKLIEPCILAGTSAKGCCSECGAPWKRVTVEKQLTRERPRDYVKRNGAEGTGNSCANSVAGVDVKTVGWEPTCECNGKFVKSSIQRPKDSGKFVGSVKGSRGDRNDDGRGYLNRSSETVSVSALRYVSDLPLDEHPIEPCVVLDPFIGSGTTCCVAVGHGRHSIGIDLSEKYLKHNAIPRIEGELLARPALARLIRRKVERVILGERVV